MTLLTSRFIGPLGSRFPPSARAAIRRRLNKLNGPRWGNLRRREPFSAYYGFDRGTPIDRFYIERFLAERAGDIRGTVLEVGNARYARAFRHSTPARVEIVDIDERNPDITIHADLSESSSLPAERFDCFILTQTLQLVTDVEAALYNAWQGIAPAGVLLISVPGITRSDPRDLTADRWRFTQSGLETLLARTCSKGRWNVVGYGNLTSALAFLMGLAAEELSESELIQTDPHFPVAICARVEKH